MNHQHDPPLSIGDDGVGDPEHLWDVPLGSRSPNRSTSSRTSSAHSSTSWAHDPYRPRSTHSTDRMADEPKAVHRSRGRVPTEEAVHKVLSGVSKHGFSDCKVSPGADSDLGSTGSSVFDKGSGQVLYLPDVDASQPITRSVNGSNAVAQSANQFAQGMPTPPIESLSTDVFDITHQKREENHSCSHSSAVLTARIANVPVTTEVLCPEGSSFSVYDADISQHYNIDSGFVVITLGAVKYMDYHSKFGAQTRFRFQLCRRYLNQRCSSGSECPYIHSKILPRATGVHVNENCATSSAGAIITREMIEGGSNTYQYETITPGCQFLVYPPNTVVSGVAQMIPSEKVLRTTGAVNIYNVLVASKYGGTMIPQSLKPRHCAHFQFKRMCNLGSDCNFVHSLVPYIQCLAQQMPTVHQQMPTMHQQMHTVDQQMPTMQLSSLQAAHNFTMTFPVSYHQLVFPSYPSAFVDPQYGFYTPQV